MTACDSLLIQGARASGNDLSLPPTFARRDAGLPALSRRWVAGLPDGFYQLHRRLVADATVWSLFIGVFPMSLAFRLSDGFDTQ